MSNIIVLKCGGSTINTLSDSFFKNIITLQHAGLKPVIVHGGGPEIKAMLDRLNIKSETIRGNRKTTLPVMDVVEMVLTGAVSNGITRKLHEAGINSIGLSGSDAGLLTAVAKNFDVLGYVGEITNVNVPFLTEVINNGIVPVIAPIAIGEDGTRYNVNADTVAGEVAKAMEAKQLIFVTDVPGIMKDGEMLDSVTEEEVYELISSGTIYGGMIPKVEAAIASLSEELQEAMIVDGNQPILDITETSLVGTVIKKSMEVSTHVGNISNV